MQTANWTKWEDDFLIENYSRIGSIGVGLKLNRTAAMVKRRATTLRTLVYRGELDICLANLRSPESSVAHTVRLIRQRRMDTAGQEKHDVSKDSQ